MQGRTQVGAPEARAAAASGGRQTRSTSRTARAWARPSPFTSQFGSRNPFSVLCSLSLWNRRTLSAVSPTSGARSSMVSQEGADPERERRWPNHGRVPRARPGRPGAPRSAAAPRRARVVCRPGSCPCTCRAAMCNVTAPAFFCFLFFLRSRLRAEART